MLPMHEKGKKRQNPGDGSWEKGMCDTCLHAHEALPNIKDRRVEEAGGEAI